MTCYFVAQIRIDDEAEYQKYLESCDEVFARFRGKYLAVDAAPLVLEGTWPYSRTVIIQFASEADLLDWYTSADYRHILKHRLAAGRSDALLVHGNDEAPA